MHPHRISMFAGKGCNILWFPGVPQAYPQDVRYRSFINSGTTYRYHPSTFRLAEAFGGQRLGARKTCERCRNEVRDLYTFDEINKLDERRRFGSFCNECTRELVDELRGKLEWIRFEQGWRGYIHPQARMELEASGFIQAGHKTQLIEIVGMKRAPAGERAVLEILRLEYASGLISREEYEKHWIEARKKL